MTLFRYKAVTGAGETLEGAMEAPNREAVVQQLQAQGHLPISAEEADKGDAVAKFLQRDLLRRGLASRQDIALITRNIATLLRAGVTLERSLEILTELADRQAVRQLVAQILDRIRGGAALSDALAAAGGIFPQYYVSMVRAGEAGGTVETVLERLADFLDRRQQALQTVRSALIYPAILVVMAVLAVILLLGWVVPRFQPMFEDAGKTLPLATEIVIGLGDAVSNYWWLMALGLFALWALAQQLLRDPARRLRWHRGLARLPVVGDLLIKAEIARFTRTLGTLVGNGVGLLSALTLARESLGNSAIAREIDTAAAGVKEGRSLSQPLMRAELFPSLATHLIRVGEETGQLDSMLIKVADIYDEEVRRSIDRMLALLVPVLTIILGVIIAAIIGSILAAILSVYDLPI